MTYSGVTKQRAKKTAKTGRPFLMGGLVLKWMTRKGKYESVEFGSGLPIKRTCRSFARPTCIVRMSKRPRKRVTEMIRSKAVLKRSAEVLQHTKELLIEGKADTIQNSAAKRSK
jgi:hypothetical protein